MRKLAPGGATVTTEPSGSVTVFVRRFLSDACEISQAATGAEALAILGREQIAAVVLKHPRASSATATNY